MGEGVFLGQLQPFAALIICEEHKAARVETTQQYQARRWPPRARQNSMKSARMSSLERGAEIWELGSGDVEVTKFPQS